jgi:hypothetical protein
MSNRKKFIIASVAYMVVSCVGGFVYGRILMQHLREEINR